MALGYTANSILAQLDDLRLSSPTCELHEPQEHTSSKMEPISAKSLLSGSLAEDASTYEKAPSPVMFVGMDVEQLRDEHPEPSLLATSVGKEQGGRFLPSSSTISLLSLSNNSNHCIANGQVNASGNINNSLSGISNATAHNRDHNSLNYLENLNQKLGQSFAPLERGNSSSNVRSRNWLNLSGQQRLQQYQRLTSPGLTFGEFALISSLTSITCPQNIPMKKSPQLLFTPSSPSLDPTSVANSPSGFWLNSHSPPNTYITDKVEELKEKMNKVDQRCEKEPSPEAVNMGKREYMDGVSLHLTSGHFDIERSGGQSPILNPVQTPLEDMPMTPLYLSSDGNLYFVLSKTEPKTKVSYGFKAARMDEEEEQLDVEF